MFRAQPMRPGLNPPEIIAVKCIRPDLADDDEMIEMMVDEARIAGQLNHENIASVLDSGRVGDSFFIAMEYIHGIDLATILKQLRRKNLLLPMPHTLRIMASVCEALHAAHSQTDGTGNPLRIVHRDVSPHNVLISFSGDVKLIDFGVARASRRTTKTAVGVIKGKLTYMAPEQALGRRIHGRADIFSVGVSLFRILTGTLPYQGDTDIEIFRQLTTRDAPAASTRNRRIPRQVDALISRCLQRNPANRYGSAGDVAAALRAAGKKHWPTYNPASLSSYMRSAFGGLIQEDLEATPTPSALTPRRDVRRNTEVILSNFTKREAERDEWDELQNDPTAVMPIEVIRANALAAMDEDEDFYLGSAPETADTVVAPNPLHLPKYEVGEAPIRPVVATTLRQRRTSRVVLWAGLAALLVAAAVLTAVLATLLARREGPNETIAAPASVGAPGAVERAESPGDAIHRARGLGGSALRAAEDVATSAVVITIESSPPGAEVLWRGNSVGFTPTQIIMPQGSRAEDVVVRSPDGVERGLLVVPGSSQTRRAQF